MHLLCYLEDTHNNIPIPMLLNGCQKQTNGIYMNHSHYENDKWYQKKDRKNATHKELGDQSTCDNGNSN